MKKNVWYKFVITNMSLLIIGITLMLQSCNRGTADKNESASKNPFEMIVSENDFLSVPDSVKPWVYYWWLKGNVTKELITRDLEEMKKKGIGGFLLFDSRGYYDDYNTGILKLTRLMTPLNPFRFDWPGKD